MMSPKSLDRLGLRWKGFRFLLQHQPACSLHFQKQGSKDTSYKHLQKTCFRNLQQRNSSSNIVKSPFGEVEIPNKLIGEIIWETVDRVPEKKAVKCGITNRAFTYAEIQKLSLRFANSLLKAGFKKGDVISVVLHNCPETAVVVLGALQAELILSLVNHTCTSDEMCHQLKMSGTVCIVSAPDNLDVVQSAITKVEQATKSKPIQMIIAVDTPSVDSLPRGVRRWTEMIADGVDQLRLGGTTVHPDELGLLLYSSGTTGLSKGVCLSHKNIVSNLFQTIDSTEILPSDVLLGLLPFYHVYGLSLILLNGLKAGSLSVTLPKFKSETLLQTMESEKLSVLMIVPPIVSFLAQSKVTPKHLAHVRLLFSGAAPLGASDLNKIKHKFPQNAELYQGYGLTELAPIATYPRRNCPKKASVGVPAPSTCAKVIDPKTGVALGPNQNGELCFKGPQMMLGYLNNPKATAEIIDADGWLRTGDIGYYDEDCNFYVMDRLKELIKVNSLQVPPAELEEVLRTNPEVADAGVIGVPCPKKGEVPVAFVVPENNTLTAEDVMSFLAEKVSRHKQVAEVIFIDEIPKSASGKILRKNLKEIYRTTSNRQK